jgi:hypothetical protein
MTMRGIKRQRIVINQRLIKKSVASYWVGSYDRCSNSRNRQNRNRQIGGDSKGFGNPSKAAAVGSKTLTGSWLVAGSVSVFKLVGSEGPDDEFSKFGVGERKRFLVFLAALLGEEVPNPLAQILHIILLYLICNPYIVLYIIIRRINIFREQQKDSKANVPGR